MCVCVCVCVCVCKYIQVQIPRVDSEMIADKRLLFEKFTHLQNALVPYPAGRDIVEECIVAWTKVETANAQRHSYLVATLRQVQEYGS